MNKNKILLGSTAVLSLAAASCHDSIDFEAARRESVAYTYAQDFKSHFGEADPEQDYNMAARVTAAINLEGISGQECKVCIFSSSPLSGGKLLAAVSVSGSRSLDFDIEKGQNNVYVEVSCDDILLSYGYHFIENQLLQIGQATRAAMDELCPTTIDKNKILDQGGFWDNDWSPSHNYQNKPYGTVYYLNNVQTSQAPAFKVKDLAKIVGKGQDAYFGEGVNNRELYKDKFDKNVILTVAENGPVTISNQFGGTAFTNQFGYYYYYDGATPEQTLQNKIDAKKIVIMDQAEPHNNITVDGQSFADDSEKGMYLPNKVIAGYENGWNGITGEELVQGTTYHLVYFDANGNGSFTFPKGIHVGFFIRTLANHTNLSASDYAAAEKQGWNIVYSDSELNGYYGKWHDANAKVADWEAVTYSVKNSVTTILPDGTKDVTTTRQNIVGFEDGYDKDMNDILCIVTGVESSPIPPVDTIEPEPNSWILACEDMGAIGDYDFNDVVFKVAHVAGQNTIIFTPLAAGGTLGSVIYRDEERIGEIHLLLDNYSATSISGAFPMLRTQKGSSIAGGKSIPLTLSDSEVETFTMSAAKGSTIAGGFQVKVVTRDKDVNNDQQDGSYAAIVTAQENGAAPQMLVLPGNWIWPTERTHISSAYPKFSEWVQNATTTDWSTGSIDQLMVQPY